MPPIDTWLLGHDLEQRRLHLGRRPVDLVGEHEVGEHGAELDVELLARRPVDPGADDVGGQQVGRELDAGERAADDAGQRLDRQGLGQAGHALEQAVAPGEQAHEQALDGAVLADDHLLDLEQRRLELCSFGRARARRAHRGKGTPTPIGRRSVDAFAAHGRICVHRVRPEGGTAGRKGDRRRAGGTVAIVEILIALIVLVLVAATTAGVVASRRRSSVELEPPAAPMRAAAAPAVETPTPTVDAPAVELDDETIAEIEDAPGAAAGQGVVP